MSDQEFKPSRGKSSNYEQTVEKKNEEILST